MTSSIATNEELFRFASTRAPSPAPRQAGLLELADDTQVPAWLAAPLPDFAIRLDALDARWQALAERSSEAIAADLRAAGQEQRELDLEHLFPIVPASDSAGSLATLLTELWTFFLQGVASGQASAPQLQRAQQLMGQVSLLQAFAADGVKAIAPEAIAGALAPVVRLPAAFEQQLQVRRDQQLAARRADSERLRTEQDDALNVLAHTLETLGALEQRLIAALDQAAEASAAQEPAPQAGCAADAGSLEKRISFQRAADSALAFRQHNDALLQQLAEAGVATATLNPFQLLDAVRRRAAGGPPGAARRSARAHHPAHGQHAVWHPPAWRGRSARGAPNAAQV